MAMPTKIMVIRHAEKPDDKHKGVTSHGDEDNESLIVRGWQRAGALTVLFDPTIGSLQNAALAVPKAIYASDPKKASEADDDDDKKGSKSKRPLQTITPLAERLGIKDKVKVKFAKGDEKHMVESVLAESGVVVRPNGPAIVSTSSGSSRPPQWGFVQVPQQLLSGDANTVLS